jgi:hypothetical protein
MQDLEGGHLMKFLPLSEEKWCALINHIVLSCIQYSTIEDTSNSPHLSHTGRTAIRKKDKHVAIIFNI